MGATTIPILPSADLDVTVAFYELLGFTEELPRHPGYLIMSRDNVELHFWLKTDVEPMTNDVACYLRYDTVTEVRARYTEWSRLDLGERLRPPVETDYGMVEFALIDPHGNLLRIGALL
ncbi:bleomycin resistance protein [Longimycelium tulufanense]|uniref:Bleomycin resistance protein n=1 Tax=Longimycelium tulufanense TaxID=907463 RepID=A0A8J3FXK8_9PSEU|nr:VOC family protein [Longimycelium tulufanense]GGM80492.1 bleomycin resistance protein [Longimycelium tulufanense]